MNNELEAAVGEFFDLSNIKTKNRSVAIIRAPQESLPSAVERAFNPDGLERFYSFWALMDAIKAHGYVRAAMSVYGRSAVGAWWTLREKEEYRGLGTGDGKDQLLAFYNRLYRTWDNIQDYRGMAYNLMIATMYLRYFGQAAFVVVHNEFGYPLGMDFLHGYVVPNVDENGYFKTPAFVQYPTSNPLVFNTIDDPLDVVFITNPDWEGHPSGGSDVEALADYTLPIDIYLLTAARSYLQNRDRPEVIYELNSDISDDAFDAFVEMLEQKYAGVSNLGKNPVAVRGEVNVHELSKLPSDLPYQDARNTVRDETLAVTGVAGVKLGLSRDMTNANLRESRREFHETSMIPVLRFLETGFYEQIHVRLFGLLEWEFAFNSLDFLTAVERATVHMRYHGMGVLNPNEIRHEIGRPQRDDDLGDKYKDQLENPPEQDSYPGSPPEGREDEPDSPAQIGEPTLDDQDPPRGDQHDESMLRELARYRRFVLKRLQKGQRVRKFSSDVLPENILSHLHAALSDIKPGEGAISQAKALFDGARAVIQRGDDEG